MNEVILDVETTTYENGNPYSRRNKLCLVGVFPSDGPRIFDIEYTESPYGACLKEIKHILEEADLVVGFNLKFDLAWIRRYIPDLKIKAVWDCQLKEYMQSCQSNTFPSLDKTCEKHGLGTKDKTVSEMWEKGIDTPNIPLDILVKYLRQDLEITRQLFNSQWDYGNGYTTLFRLACEDLLILQQMEETGLQIDTQTLKGKTILTQDTLTELAEKLKGYADINWNSAAQLSHWLYEDQGVKPLPRTESIKTKDLNEDELTALNAARFAEKKAPVIRIWSVTEDVLRSLKLSAKQRKVVDLYLEYKK